MALPLPAAVALERAIETVLRLDPATRDRLVALDGRLVRFRVTSPSVDVTLGVVDGRVFVPSSGDDGPVDATITGSLSALRSLAGSSHALYRGDVTIEGDIGVGMALRGVATGLDMDLAEAVAPLVGDALAHRLDRAAGAFAGWLGRSRGAMRENARDWLEDEAELVATRAETVRFAGDVDAVREGVDRLDARLRVLERRTAGTDDAGGAGSIGGADGSGPDGKLDGAGGTPRA